MIQLGDEVRKNPNVFSKSREKKIQRKQKRLQHMIADDSGIFCCDQPTRVHFENRAKIVEKMFNICFPFQ